MKAGKVKTACRIYGEDRMCSELQDNINSTWQSKAIHGSNKTFFWHRSHILWRFGAFFFPPSTKKLFSGTGLEKHMGPEEVGVCVEPHLIYSGSWVCQGNVFISVSCHVKCSCHAVCSFQVLTPLSLLLSMREAYKRWFGFQEGRAFWVVPWESRLLQTSKPCQSSPDAM